MMAQDWLKVCKETPDKRELSLIATHMKASKGDVFLWWFRLYSWADGQTADGFLPHMTLNAVAHGSGVPLEFCTLLSSEEIAWVYHVEPTRTKPHGVMVANWQRHNGKSAKRRAEDALRKGSRRK